MRGDARRGEPPGERILVSRGADSYDPLVHTLRVLHELPPGYGVEESPGGILAVHVDVALGLHQLGFGPEHDGRLVASDLAGRHPLRELRLGSERFVVRSFHHGGLLRWLTGRRFLDPERPFRELILAHAMNRAGLRTPQVVAARARFRPGGGFWLDAVSRRVDDSLDVGIVLGRVQRGELAPVRARPLYRALGRLVRALHDAHVLHADLTPRNVLVERSELGSEQPALWVLDLEGSRIVEELSERDRLDNLRRLLRHVERMQRADGPFLTRTDTLRFLRAYHRTRSEGPRSQKERQRWKDDWLAIEHTRRRRRVLHELGWWLDARFGRLSTLPARERNAGSR